MKNQFFKRSLFQKAYAAFLGFSIISTALVISNRNAAAQKISPPQPEMLSTRSVATISALPVEVPDGDANGTNLFFNVSGVHGIVSHIEISFGFNPAHAWAGDIKAALYSPDNNSHTLIDRVGETIAGGAGDSSDLAGPYTFSDQGGDIWAAAGNVGSEVVIPSGFYRTTSGGSPAFTNMDSIFAGPGLSANQFQFKGMDAQLANGIWRLNVSDNGEGDTGSLNEANLTIFYSLSTAANVSVGGSVKTERGGIRGATVMLIGGNLIEPRYVKTNNFGNYTFEDLPTGQIYVVSVMSKKYVFSQPSIVLDLQNNVANADFIASE